MKRILVIDDEPSIVMVFEEYLTMEGYEVLTAHNGKEGLARLSNGSSPDLVLVDLKMPEIGGKMLVMQMREKAELNHIPVIIVTGSVMINDDFPPDGTYQAVIFKPFRLEDVLAKIEEFI